MKEQVYDLQSVAKSSASERASFIRRTYAHLAVAILGFIAIEYYLVNSPFAAKLASSMTGGMSWLIVLGQLSHTTYKSKMFHGAGAGCRRIERNVKLDVCAQADM